MNFERHEPPYVQNGYTRKCSIGDAHSIYMKSIKCFSMGQNLKKPSKAGILVGTSMIFKRK